jgi:hypothetical protein
MMFPTVALYARMTRRRGLSRSLWVTSAYLLVWATAGVAAYGRFRFGRGVPGPELAWNAGADGSPGVGWPSPRYTSSLH